MKKNPTRTQYGFGIVVNQTMPTTPTDTLKEILENFSDLRVKAALIYGKPTPPPSIEAQKKALTMFFQGFIESDYMDLMDDTRFERMTRCYEAITKLLDEQNPISSPSNSETK